MANRELVYGFPLANADNVYGILAELGVVPWKVVEGPMSVTEYAKRNLGSREREDIKKYAPKDEVIILRNPKDGRVFVAFRSTGRPWQTTFALLPNPYNDKDPLVVLIGEYKHGIGEITVVPPSGTVI